MFWIWRSRPRSCARIVRIGAPALALLTLAVLCDAALAATDASGSQPSFKNIATGVGAAIGAAVALLSAPGVYLGIKKTQAEIRKLELETLRLQTEQGSGAAATSSSDEHGTYSVVVEGANNVVSIVADPRLLGPLLVLLDFVVATIVLTLAGYLMNFGGLSLFSPLLAVVALALFVPIFREARRLKRTLAPATAQPETAAPDDAPCRDPA